MSILIFLLYQKLTSFDDTGISALFSGYTLLFSPTQGKSIPLPVFNSGNQYKLKVGEMEQSYFRQVTWAAVHHTHAYTPHLCHRSTYPPNLVIPSLLITCLCWCLFQPRHPPVGSRERLTPHSPVSYVCGAMSLKSRCQGFCVGDVLQLTDFNV